MKREDVVRFFMLFLVGIASTTVQARENLDDTEQLQMQKLVAQCAPDVHPDTMLKVLKHESGFAPWIIGVNGAKRTSYRLKTKAEAVRLAVNLIAEGKSIDMGLGQINSRNLDWLELTPETVFDPCTNVAASARVLVQAYERGSADEPDAAAALDRALSIYNTGKPDKGVANGYVGKVRAARYAVPALDANAPVAVSAEPAPPPPAWDVYASARYVAPDAPPEEAEDPPPQAGEVMLFQEP